MKNDGLVLNFVPTGMVPTKQMTPHVPLSPNEIVEEVQSAFELGITLVHLHARDNYGKPTYKIEFYDEIVSKLRTFCPDLVLCISLSGRNFNTLEKRSEALDLKVDMASLTLSSMNFPIQASVNDPEMIQALCEKMNAVGTNPELEVFDLGMINYSKYLIKKGFIEGPFYFNIILGNIAGLQLDLVSVGNAISMLPDGSYWSLGGIGKAQLGANSISIAHGGGVRIGLEDNIYLDRKRTKLATNIDLLKRIHLLAEIHERPIMSSVDFGNIGFYNRNRNAK